ncbi:MAG TPA: TRAP transporter large permease [Bosea sp. (in: a-proteobacteria)]
MTGFLVFGALPIGLLVAGTPIFLVLLFASVAGIVYLGGIPLTAVHTAMFGGVDSFPLLAVPLFIVAGELMARGGMAQRLVAFVLTLIGGVRGSLPLATIASASVFGAMSGSALACVAAIGRLMIPSMEKAGYKRTGAVSLVTATGVIDVIIPPSIPMIIYAIAAQVSVTDLFLAGIAPGLLIAGLLALYVHVRARMDGMPAGAALEVALIVPAFRRAFWAFMAPVVILGGIYGGVFTPTEAAGIACLYAMIVSVHVYRELTWAQVWGIFFDSARLIGQIMIIVAAAGAYAWLITTSGISAKIVAFVAGLDLGPVALLLLLNVLLLLVGSLLEPPAAILLLTPLLVPIATSVGIDPIHFGMIVTINLAIGMFLPPFGLNLFGAHAMFGTPLPALYRGVVPYLLIYLIALVAVTYVPALTLVPLSWLK